MIVDDRPNPAIDSRGDTGEMSSSHYQPAPPRPRSGLPVWAIVLFSAIGLLFVAGVVGALIDRSAPGDTGAGQGSDRSTESVISAPAASPSPVASTSRLLTARIVVDTLAQLYPLPNVRDNTGYAADAGVAEAITSDAGTVLRFSDEQKAQRWVDAMAGSADVRRVGVFVLSWAAKSEQDLTSQEARAAMHRELQRLVAG